MNCLQCSQIGCQVTNKTTFLIMPETWLRSNLTIITCKPFFCHSIRVQCIPIHINVEVTLDIIKKSLADDYVIWTCVIV
eukprot:Gb_01430 [translate_table: standard]